MSKKALIKLTTREALPLDTVELGRLLVNRRQPWQEYLPYSRLVLREQDYSDSLLNNVKDENETTSSWNFVGAVGEFFQLLLKGDRREAAKLNTGQEVVRRLHNSPNFLARLCKARFVREWLQRTIEIDEKPVYLVTGLITVKDAAINRDASSSMTAGGNAQAPVTALATHGASEALPDKQAHAVDPKVQMNKANTAKATISFDAPGVRIIAVEYTRVRLRRRTGMELAEADVALDTTSAKWKDSFRGVGSADIVEVYLGAATGGDEEEEEDEDESEGVDEDEGEEEEDEEEFDQDGQDSQDVDKVKK